MARASRSRAVVPLWVALLVAAQLLTVIAARASSPPSQSATVPSRAGKTVTIKWTGTIPPGAAPSECTSGLPTEDHHAIRLSVPKGIYANFQATATFGIIWDPSSGSGSTNDEVLTVYGPDGEVIDSSDGGDPSEAVTVFNPVAGTYDVVACGFLNATPQPYTGTLTIRTVAFSQPGRCRAPTPPKVSFAPPVYIDQNRAGGEPVSDVAQDG
ncbi:MAG: hypothetical protein ABR518_04330 [Actinomycetota bacterium]